MKHLLLVFILALGLAGSARIAPLEAVGAPNSPYQYQSAGAGQYGVDISTVKTLTIPAGTIIAEICVPTVGANYTTTGTVPTTTAGTGGMPVAAGACFQLSGVPLASLKIIGGAGALMSVEYFK